MYIDFSVNESSVVEQTSDSVEILQGESNLKIFRFTLPTTIRGYAIANFTQEIAFKSEKGEVLTFDMTDGEIPLTSEITKFKSVLVQLVLTKDGTMPIIWRSIPFKYEFTQSINAVNEIGD